MNQWKKIVLICSMLLLVFFCLSGAAAAETADEKAAWVVENNTRSDMTEEEKALALHDWLTDNAYYDSAKTSANRNEASGVLLDGTGVCDSYAKAYVLLLSKVGIEAKRVTGEAVKSNGTKESHAWNLVKLAGRWYQVDVTWDDPINPNNPTAKKSGLEHHLYFKASKRFMNEEHVPDAESAKLIDSLVADDGTEPLPASVDHSASHTLYDFHLVTAAGQKITMETVAGKDMILVYGRITCGNTKAFLSDISPYMEHLTRKGIEVVVALCDDPSAAEINAFAANYPGVICAKQTSEDDSMWKGLSAFNLNSGSVVFPVIFLKNKSNKLTYCSTNYVEKPLTIVAGALDMAKNEGDNPGPAVIANGICGYSVSWELDNEGLLLITGTDQIYDYEADKGSPWDPAKVKKVSMSAGITRIGKYAFYQCAATEIPIPDSVATIGDYAFCGSGITSLSLPDGLTHIGDYAFHGTGIESVSLPDKLVNIGEYAFYGTAIESISIPDSITYIGSQAFGNCSKLTEITVQSRQSYACQWAVDNGYEGILNVLHENDGWKDRKGFWYYYENGQPATGWKTIDGIWYYFEPDGKMAIGWVLDGGQYYFMSSSGQLCTGWIQAGGSWFYLNSNGAMYTGWMQSGDTWYLLTPSGAMAVGWCKDGGNWYYFDASGAMLTGWQYIGGSWYYFKDSGAMATGWFEDTGAGKKLWYWFDGNGQMATGWKEIDQQWEMFSESGEWLYTWDGK